MEQFTIAQRVLIVKTFIRTDRLISRNVDHQRPPKSCDLTLLIFFPWGTLKSLVYDNKPLKDPQLKGGNWTSCQAVIVNFTDRVVAEVVICPTSFCIPEM